MKVSTNAICISFYKRSIHEYILDENMYRTVMKEQCAFVPCTSVIGYAPLYLLITYKVTSLGAAEQWDE